MSFLGIPDPTIWLAYVGCFACVLFCLVWGHLKDKEFEDDGE